MRISYNIWMTRLATLLVWALVGAIAVFWWLKTTQNPVLPVAPVVPDTFIAPDTQAVARALGAQDVAAAVTLAAPVASRLTLLGVLSGQQSGGGAALIAADGQPPKTYRVGAEVSAGMVLQSLDVRIARLGTTLGGSTVLTLEMPPQD